MTRIESNAMESFFFSLSVDCIISMRSNMASFYFQTDWAKFNQFHYDEIHGYLSSVLNIFLRVQNFIIAIKTSPF